MALGAAIGAVAASVSLGLSPPACPADALPNCAAAHGTVIYVQRVDPDGDGDAHFVLRSDQSITLPGVSVIHVLLSAALVGLILMHSGRDTGMGGMGFTPASQGGTHIVERNLTRLTIVVAVLFFANTVLLFRLLK